MKMCPLSVRFNIDIGKDSQYWEITFILKTTDELACLKKIYEFAFEEDWKVKLSGSPLGIAYEKNEWDGYVPVHIKITPKGLVNF